MNDDLNTAKVLASKFELVPVINGLKDKHIAADALSSPTIALLQQQMKFYIEDILGLRNVTGEDNNKLKEVMQILIELRKDAKAKKDFVTSDKIRNQLAELVVMKNRRLPVDYLGRALAVGVVDVVAGLRCGGVNQALVLVVGKAVAILGDDVAVGVVREAGAFAAADPGDSVAAALVAVGGRA